MDFYSMSAEKETIMNIPVSTIMNTSPIISDKNKTLSDIASLMKEKKLMVL
jgi:hypothetical protein